MAAGSKDGGFIHPMDQFEIKPLFGGEVGLLTITNSTLWMAICILAVWLTKSPSKPI